MLAIYSEIKDSFKIRISIKVYHLFSNLESFKKIVFKRVLGLTINFWQTKSPQNIEIWLNDGRFMTTTNSWVGQDDQKLKIQTSKC